MNESQREVSNWEWGIGEKSSTYYDYWMYRNDDEYEIHVYWDGGNPHTIQLHETRENSDGDVVTAEYAERTVHANSESEAIETACNLADEYNY